MIQTGVLAFLVLIIIYFASHGFDITDDSFYLLWAANPELIKASATQFGYYTNLLYILSGENIAIFRILGIVSLLMVAGVFSIELEKYWFSGSVTSKKKSLRWQPIILILTSTLVYYRSWLITPSYNWLALFSTIIVGTGLLRLTRKCNEKITLTRINILFDGLLIGFGGGLAFMAKPTTAFSLAILSIIWLYIHPLSSNRKIYLGISSVTACLVLLFHATVFKEGIIPFYCELREGMRLVKILGAGHTIGHIFGQAITDVKLMPSHVISIAPVWILSCPIIICLVRWNKVQCRNVLARNILYLYLSLFLAYVCFRLLETGQWSRAGIGFSGLSLLLVIMLGSIATKYAWRKVSTDIVGKIPFMRFAFLCIFLIMLAGAYAFGSANGLIKHMSGAYIFLSAGAIYAALWTDEMVDSKLLCNVVSVLVTISVVVVMVSAFNKPYRLPDKTSMQNIKISFLESKGFLFVDQKTSRYINDLKTIALNAGWIPGTPLIDLTGGSPGANVILGGEILGTPWLIGGYEGSGEFTKVALEMVPKEKQKFAWVLTAPNGSRKIHYDVLMDIGLRFPDDYVEIGKVRTGHRNEIQVLWKSVRK
jgi:hypothetical protein